MRGLREMVFVVVCAGLVIPHSARAQAPAAATPPVTSGFDNGFFVQSSNGDYRLVFGLNLQVDGRFALDDPLPITNTFLIRKARPTLSGRVAKYFEFKVMPDFGNGVAVLQDAWFDTRFSTALHLRVGRDKVPVGYEWMIGDANTYFPERALPTSLMPLRDVGIQALGDVASGRVSYAGGLFNGVPDGTPGGDVDTNSDKDFAGRIVVQPFRTWKQAAWSGLGFHVGGSVGTASNGLPSFRTSVGQIYYSYASGASANGQHTRVSPAAFYFFKSFGTFGEYVLSTQDVARAGVTHAIDNHAMDVTAAWYITGEPGGIGVTRPRKPFDPSVGHWGTVQVLARFSHLEVAGDAFIYGLAAPGASRRADQWTVGFNWFPTAFTKWYATYERTTFDQNAAGSRPAENAILFRAQLAF